MDLFWLADRIMARAFDRGHSIRLIQAGVDYQVRETFESALRFGERALIELGLEDREAARTIRDVRRRDEARLDLQLTGGLKAGRQLMRGNLPTPQPAPYIKPKREGRLLNEDEAFEAALRTLTAQGATLVDIEEGPNRGKNLGGSGAASIRSERDFSLRQGATSSSSAEHPSFSATIVLRSLGLCTAAQGLRIEPLSSIAR